MRYLPLALLLPFSSPVVAANHEILAGRAILTREGQNYWAGKGTKLYEGDRLTASPEVQVLGDYGYFFAISRGAMAFPILRREGCGVRDAIVYSGFLSIRTRPKTCYSSVVDVISATFGHSFRLNSGAVLQDKEDAALLAVREGLVVVSNLGASVSIPSSFGSTNLLGETPGKPVKLSPSLTLQSGQVDRSALGAILHLKASPLSQIFVLGGRSLGWDRYLMPWGSLGNDTRILIRSPFGDEQVFVLPRVERR